MTCMYVKWVAFMKNTKMNVILCELGSIIITFSWKESEGYRVKDMEIAKCS